MRRTVNNPSDCSSEDRVANNLFVVLGSDSGVLVSNVDVQLLGTLDDGLNLIFNTGLNYKDENI